MKVIKAIGHAIVFVFDGFARFCAFLLVALGLWLPFVYSLAFLLIYALSPLSFNGLAQKIYFIGLAVTTVLGVSFAIFWKLSHPVAAVRKSAKKPNKPRSYSHKIEKNDANCLQNDDIIENSNDYENKTADARGTDDELSKKYFSPTANTACENEKKPTIEDGVSADSALGADELWARLTGNGAERVEEKPLVFATRSDPHIFIYEFSDRLQYWRKGLFGMTLLGTEFKKPTPKQEEKSNIK